METTGAADGGRKFLAIEHSVALILAETASSAEAYPRLLEAIATALGWEFGAVWEEAPGPAAFVRCAETWCAEEARLNSNVGALAPPDLARNGYFGPPIPQSGHTIGSFFVMPTSGVDERGQISRFATHTAGPS